MLGKTANGLFWMYRYLERAENTLKLIETGQRIALTRSGSSDDDWNSVLATADSGKRYRSYHEKVTKDGTINWLLRDLNNPSSVLSCVAAARQNARLIRTALTYEVWEAVNSAYMYARHALARKVSERELAEVLGEIRQRATLVRGTTHGTMLRNDIYNFARIGTFLERADSTARILDVKYYVLLPSIAAVGSSIDNVQWESILRSVSARGGFRMEYGSSGNARDIAQFLILDQRLPRSLAFCAQQICDNLGELSQSYGGEQPCLALARELANQRLSQTIDAIFDGGLHEFIREIIDLLIGLSGQIERDYRFYE